MRYLAGKYADLWEFLRLTNTNLADAWYEAINPNFKQIGTNNFLRRSRSEILKDILPEVTGKNKQKVENMVNPKLWFNVPRITLFCLSSVVIEATVAILEVISRIPA